jgi:O-antigen ligase
MTFEAAAALLPVFITCSQERRALAEVGRFWPVRLLLALVVWSILSFLTAPDKMFAAQGLLFLISGTLVCLAVTTVRADAQRQFLLAALCAASLLASVSGIALFLHDHRIDAQGLYHDHQLYGAALLMPLMLMLAIGLSPVTPIRRWSARLAVLLGVIALALSVNRSTWMGAAVSLVVFLGLVLYARAGERWQLQPRRVISAFMLCAIAMLLFAAPQARPVRARMRSLTTVTRGKEWSVEWRLATWRGALMMAKKKPLQGWGIGEYPARHFAFTGTGQTAALVRSRWPNIEDEAHNSYLQIAVEMGLPGLLLWLGVLGTAFVGGVRRVRGLPLRSLPQWCLIGCLSALAGQTVDAAGNPAWQFGGVSLFFWVTLGLLAALCLGTPEPQDVCDAGPRMPSWTGILMLILGGGMLWLIWTTAHVLPAPELGPVMPIPTNRLVR